MTTFVIKAQGIGLVNKRYHQKYHRLRYSPNHQQYSTMYPESYNLAQSL